MEKLLILDYGSQFTQLIARRVRELEVFCEILPHDVSDDRIKNFDAGGIILSGGPQSTFAANAPAFNPAILALNKPILGICYGMQMMIQHFGGRVEAARSQSEYGQTRIYQSLPSSCGLWQEVGDEIAVWMSHSDYVTSVAKGFEVTAKSKDNKHIVAFSHPSKKLYGLQFHPEVVHTRGGLQLIKNFVYGICGLSGRWTTPHFITQSIDSIRACVGPKEGVLLALSGGVDSAVCAALIHKAIGNRLHCVLVDNGLLRANEANLIEQVFAHTYKLPLIRINAANQFFAALVGISDPEQKRHRIGHLFIKEFEQCAKTLKSSVHWLAQGTIYPDVVESAKSGSAQATIKTHHNVGGLPKQLSLKLLEPLRELFKDEVRRVGQELGLPSSLLNRHPFPGPGLAVRIIGEVTREKADLLRLADTIFIESLRQNDAYCQSAQAFAVLLPIQTVGVMGDSRTYDQVIALRAVSSEDFMTADWMRIDYDLLAHVSNRIINEVEGINRVVYDISSKPPATIEWE